MTYDEIVAKVANDMGLTHHLVDSTYRAFWKVIREYVKSQPLMEDLSDEEFQMLRPNVNIPSLGKLCVTLDRYRNKKKQYEMSCQNSKENNCKKDNNVEDSED